MAASDTASETALLTMRIFFQLKAVHGLVHVYFITALLGIIHIRKKKYVAGEKKKRNNPKATQCETNRLPLCISHRGLCAPEGLRGHSGAVLRHGWSWHILDPVSFPGSFWNLRPCVFLNFFFILLTCVTS